MKKVRVIILGLGAMGSLISTYIMKKKKLEVIGAVDIDQEKVGKDLGEVLKLGNQIGVKVTDDLDALFSRFKADVVIHSTVSYLKLAYLQIVKCVKAGMNVVSTCEELSYPYHKFPELASDINKLAKEHGVTVLGTGINPGFLMDTLPIVLTGPCLDIKSIKVTRMMYSGNRRDTYQRKIGTGLSPETFKKMIDDRRITGHVGLIESICMIAAALGWTLDNIQELVPESVISDKEIKTKYTTVKIGQVAGLKSVAFGIKNEKKIITLEFVSHAMIEKPYDSITIEGTPSIHERIEGGVHGDLGTVAMVINSIPKVINAEPGLLTMKDLPLPSAVLKDFTIYMERRRQ